MFEGVPAEIKKLWQFYIKVMTLIKRYQEGIVSREEFDKNIDEPLMMLSIYILTIAENSKSKAESEKGDE